MYQVNDVVIYGTHGVCKIEELVVKRVSGTEKKYYVLKPLGNGGITLFAPVDNAAVLAKIRRVLSKEEIRGLVAAASETELCWIAHEAERKEQFRSIIAGGDHKAMIQMIRLIWTQKQQREAEGKRLHVSDAHFMKEAEQLLYEEFQYVLEIGKQDLIHYIFHPEEEISV